MYAWNQLFAMSATFLALVSGMITNGVCNSSQVPAVIVTQQVNQLPSFNSVELRNGGRVTLRQGASQRVTILNGQPDCVRIAVERGNRLVIDHKGKCAGEGQLEVEVIVTSLDAVAVSNGGWLQSLDGFTNQRELAVAVNQGGMIDIRSMPVQNVTAAVIHGGRIFTRPQRNLVAAISDGGGITYWGEPAVTSNISNGGAVMKGDPAEFDKPLRDSNYVLPPVRPALPPRPPVSSVSQ